MKKIALLFVFTVLLLSCKSRAKTPPEIDYAAQGYVSATVISYEVDGCTWLLQTDEGKKYEPQNLDENFKKDQLRVWIKYQVQKNAVSVCMAGTVVKITDIKEKK